MTLTPLINPVFVFGSNEAGRHGAGAALHARNKHAAAMGCGFGYCSTQRYVTQGGKMVSDGLAHSFAIPTKDYGIQTLPLAWIEPYVKAFLAFAEARKGLQFQVTQIGCGLAGYGPSDIAPMFHGGQENVLYDTAWKNFLKKGSRYWGTM